MPVSLILGKHDQFFRVCRFHFLWTLDCVNAFLRWLFFGWLCNMLVPLHSDWLKTFLCIQTAWVWIHLPIIWPEMNYFPVPWFTYWENNGFYLRELLGIKSTCAKYLESKPALRFCVSRQKIGKAENQSNKYMVLAPFEFPSFQLLMEPPDWEPVRGQLPVITEKFGLCKDRFYERHRFYRAFP